MIKFYCNKCGKGVKAPDKYAGKIVKCPSCKTENLLPGDDEVMPYQVEGIEVKDYSGIFCQQCGAKMYREAIVCPKCGCENTFKKITKTETRIGTGSLVAAYVLSILAPLLGMIAGIYLLCKEEVPHGIACILLSLFVGIPFSLIFWAMIGVA